MNAETPMRYRRWFEILVALDTLAGTFVGGWADETMSAFAWRKQLLGEQRGRNWVRNIDWLAKTFFRQENHCQQAWANDLKRRALPPYQRIKTP